MTTFTEDFFCRDVLFVAPRLLGAKITARHCRGGITSGIVCEVEAYGGENDPASHAFRGRTPRNSSMFLKGGHLYVYLIYGIHHCLNIVTGPEGCGQAVLIRALMPLEGESLMRKRRGVPARTPSSCLTDGPGKVCKSLFINRSWCGKNLFDGGPFEVTSAFNAAPSSVLATPRIGISKAKDYKWRFVLNPETCEKYRV